MDNEKQFEFTEIMKRLRRIETRQFRHAQLQGLDITDSGDKSRIRYDAVHNNVHLGSLDVSLSLVVRVLAASGCTGRINMYHNSVYVGCINAEVASDPATVSKE